MNEDIESDQHEDMKTGGVIGFIKQWKTLFCWFAGMVLIVIASGFVGSTEREPAPVIPDKVASYSACKITDKDSEVFYKSVRHTVSSSCGYFRVSAKISDEIEVGSVYDLETSQYQGKGELWIVEFKEPTTKAP